MLEPAAAYVHFPWCVKKCPYCDFNSHPLKDSDSTDAYSAALIADWHYQQQHFALQGPLHSVFLGGGTPSLFSPDQIYKVLSQLPLQCAEVTMEANPGTTEHADFADYSAAGVTRLSLGAQSFNDTQLKALGRIHSAAETHSAYAQARMAGFDNINLDLMWGLPGQSVTQALTDLETAIALAPEHLSWYQLTVEAKTEFARRPPILPVEDTLADIETRGLELLAQAGYERYEVSAFARTGKRCRHNVNYWSFGDYVGIGAGAHGKLSTTPQGLVRTRKPSQPRLYLTDSLALEQHPIDAQAVTLEFMMNALRLVEGVPFSTFEQTSRQPWHAVQPVWQTLLDQGLVQSERCATTPLGLRYLDSVLAAFL